MAETTMYNDLLIEGKVKSTGGKMAGYFPDSGSLQLRNIGYADKKPLDSEGIDGDILIALGEEADHVDAYTKTESDEKFSTKKELADGLAGKQPAGNYASISDIPDISPLATKKEVTEGLATKQPVGSYATKTELQTGLTGKQDAGDYALRSEIPSTAGLATEAYVNSKVSSVYKVKGSCTTAQLASKAKTTGDVWNLTDTGLYGPAGANVVWSGTEWDALAGIYDMSGYVPTSRTINDKALTGNISLSASDVGALPSNGKAVSAGTADKATQDGDGKVIADTYATKGEIPDISGKLDKSGGTLTGPLVFPTVESMPLIENPTTVAVTDAGGNLGYKPLSNFLTVSAEDYVENAHVWFRNSIWAKSISCNNLSAGQFSATWLQSTSVSDLNAVPNLYPVFRDDKWIYSRTKAEMMSDLGVNDKQNKVTYSTSAPSSAEGTEGDLWIQI